MFYSPRIRTGELVQFCQRVGSSLQAGVDVRTVFQGEAERGPRRQRVAVRQVRDRIAEGDSLTDGLTSCNGFFPTLVLSIVEVCEASGKLPDGFLRLAAHYEHRRTLRRTFLAGIAWPLIQLVAAIAIVGLLIWIMGLIGGMRGEPIDALGFGLTGTSGLMIYLCIVGGCGLAVTMIIWSAARGAAWFRPLVRLAMSLPLMGRALRTIALERCAWSLGITLDTAMDARQAVRLALAATANEFFTRHTEKVEREVARGQDLAAALRATGVFPADFLHALEVGEQSGRAAEAMTALAASYESQSRTALGTLTMLAGCAVWVIVFGLIIAVIFRLALFYIGIINSAANGDFF